MIKEINIPEGWKEVKLGEICHINSNSLTDKTDENLSFYYIDLSMVNDGAIEYPSNQILFKNSPSRARRIFKKGDILMSTVRPNLLGHAIIKSEVKNCICSTGFAVVEEKNGLSCNEYIYPNLFSYNIKKQIDSILVGSNYPAINSNDVKNLKILLPPLPEQKEIASILEKWDEAIEKTAKLIEVKKKKFEWLKNSLFDKEFKLYKESLSDYCSILKQDKISNVGDLKPLTVKLHCRGIEANERDIKITLSNKGRPYFRRFSGEFLIGRQNFHNGGFGIVPSKVDGFIASNAITSLDVNFDKLDTEYLFYFFSRKNYYLRIGHIMDGTGQKELSDKQIMHLPVSAPEIEEQRKIVATLNTAKKEITILEEILAKYKSQKKGLMQKLLTGKIRLNNINSIN